MTPLLELHGVAKRFGPVQACREVSLRLEQGTILGLIGENGAGKSTLMSLVYGLHRPDAGRVLVQGSPLPPGDPASAIAAGIGMVHQHFTLVEPFTVLENLLLGLEGGALLGLGRRRLRRMLEALAAEHGLEVPLDQPVAALPLGLKQRVEILKALVREARILILDEPTAVLTPPETERLFALLCGLRERGHGVILISHKLREVLALCDRVAVMRRGALVAELAVADATREGLAELMIGRPLAQELPRAPLQPGEELLRVQGLEATDDRGAVRLRGIDFALHAGEIIGIAGVNGSGQSELLETLAGMRAAKGGQIWLNRQPLDREGREGAATGRHLAGLRHVPEDRLAAALVPSFAAWENLRLGAEAADASPWLHRRALRRDCRERMDAYDIRPPLPGLPAAAFSGGNQQKLVLAREIGAAPRVLLVGQPTRGVDIGAAAFIHRRLLALRDRGAAILLVSAELEELLTLSDRILVLFEGRIAGEVPSAQADECRLGLLMTTGCDPAAASRAIE